MTLAGAVALVLLPIFACAQSQPSKGKDLLVVVKNGRYGYIDHKGKMVIRPQFLWGEDFDHGFAWVYVCSRDVLIDESGSVVPKKQADAYAFSNGLRLKQQGNKYGFIDTSGKFKIDAIYDDVRPFSDGLAAVRVHSLWGFIDTSGREAIPPKFKEAYYFREGVGLADTDSGSVLIDKTGAVIASGYEYLSGITAEGRVPVSRGQKYGYMDLHGNIAVPLEYDFANSFSRGLAAVKKGDKWGYIDRDGHERIPFVFDDAGEFASGLAPVRIGKESGFIDKSGKFAFHLTFRQAPGFLTGNDEGLFVADSDVSRFWTSDERFGYVNTSGKVIWGPVEGSPDHWPILGWSEKEMAESCKGIPREMREAVAKLPQE